MEAPPAWMLGDLRLGQMDHWCLKITFAAAVCGLAIWFWVLVGLQANSVLTR